MCVHVCCISLMQYKASKEGTVMGVAVSKVAMLTHCQALTQACNYCEGEWFCCYGNTILYCSYTRSNNKRCSFMHYTVRDVTIYVCTQVRRWWMFWTLRRTWVCGTEFLRWVSKVCRSAFVQVLALPTIIHILTVYNTPFNVVYV